MPRKLLQLILVILVSLLLMEAAVRISGKADHLITDPAFEAAPGGGYWRYRAGFEGRLLGGTRARFGPLGSRLHPPPSSPPKGMTSRIAVFGDSVALGQGVAEDETFAARLERRLSVEGASVEVMNFGVQGHTLEMEIAHMTDRLPELRPACIVLAFISDDLRPDRAASRVDRFGYLTKHAFGPPSRWMDWARASLRRSHLALLIKEAFLRLQERRRQDEADLKGETERQGAALQSLRESVARFRDLAPGVPKIVLCADLVETDLTRQLETLMRSEFPDLSYVHAPPAFLGAPLGSLLLPRDRHPNARAHRVLADLLAPVIELRLRQRGSQEIRSP
jgi:hypothetical protein